MKVQSFFSPEVTKLLHDLDLEHDPLLAPDSSQEPAAPNHNSKLEAIPTAEDEAEFDALIAASNAQSEAFHDLFTVQPTTVYVN